MNLQAFLNEVVETTIHDVLDLRVPGIVVPSSRPQFGDFQCNGVMGAAKKLNSKPRELAQQIASSLANDTRFSQVEVAGPGFINLTLNNRFLNEQLTQQPTLTPWGQQATVVIDYSSPNLAKQLHVGHLRSTVIGDAMAHCFEFAGFNVVRQNHVGDWGTAFGRLLTYLNEFVGSSTYAIDELDALNVKANELFNSNEDFANRARATVLRLQANDAQTLHQWQQFMATSQTHMQQIYDELGISLSPDHIRGESSYNDDLPRVIDDLRTAELLTESDGASCVFLDQFKGKDGHTLPMLVQKSDGGYLYHTTDLATLRFRQQAYAPDRILYFTDARQNLHFEMLFAVAKSAGFVASSTSLEHHAFGKILGKNGKPFSTRDGSNIPLSQLLEEGVKRAAQVVHDKSQNLTRSEQTHVAKTLSVSSIKYADLSKNRVHDYTFDWDTMLALDGNTAPYLLYAYARINSVFAKAEVQPETCQSQLHIEAPEEHSLGLQLLRFQDTLEDVVSEVKPHLLCTYLYELTVRFMRFYESCAILQADTATRESRLGLCARTLQTLEVGFKCLGIQPLKRM